MSATICRSGIGNVKMELWNFNDHLMILRIMKRIIMSVGVIVAAIFTLTNCTKEMDAPQQPDQMQGVPFEFSASIQTKTANQGDGTIWSAGDAVNLYHSVASASSYVSNGSFAIAEEDLEEGKFRGELSSALESGKSYDWVAFYPYDAANTTPSSVTVSLGSAVQTGDNDMTHVAGENFPLWGVAKDVDGKLQMQLNHLSSLLEVEVLNSTSEEIIVSSVALTAQEDIAGEFTVDLTSEAPAFAAVAGKTSNTSTLTVNSAQNIGKGTSAKYYLAVKPFTAAAGSNLTLSVNGIDYEIELASDVVFTAGNIKTLKFDYDKTAAPSVTITNVAFSSADLEWTNDGLAKSFNIYVNGEKVVSDLAAEVLTYHLTGLVSGEDSVIEVEAVGDHNAAKSAGQTVKTAGIRVLDKGRHHIVIEWDEIGKQYNGTTGSGNGFERGYKVGIYKDQACSQPVYELCPYDGVLSYYYCGTTSSMLGKKGGKSYFMSTRLAMGSLEQNTDYYIRVQTLAGFSYTYSSKTYTINHPYGTTEWSTPFHVATKPAHQPAANEVIFADFDELSIFADRHIPVQGTLPASKLIGDCNDMRAIGIGTIQDVNIDTYGIAALGTSTDDAKHRDYYNGKYFNIDYSGTTTYDNYIIKEGYELQGWHVSNNVRPAMGAVMIDRARNRMIGTPALTKNLGNEEKLCVLTFDQCAFINAASKDDIIKIWIYRDGVLSAPIHSYTVSTSVDWTDSSNYEVKTEWTTKSFPLSLKSGDAVLIGTGNESIENFIAFDNFKIAVHEGAGSLEIPDWDNDGDGLEI